MSKSTAPVRPRFKPGGGGGGSAAAGRSGSAIAGPALPPPRAPAARLRGPPPPPALPGLACASRRGQAAGCPGRCALPAPRWLCSSLWRRCRSHSHPHCVCVYLGVFLSVGDHLCFCGGSFCATPLSIGLLAGLHRFLSQFIVSLCLPVSVSLCLRVSVKVVSMSVSVYLHHPCL